MDPASGMFITATGTHCGKTWVTRGIATALQAQHHPVTAIKPIETGCNPHPDDARKLAQACDRLELVSPAALYRASPPLAPYAATLTGEPPPPPLDQLVSTIEHLTEGTFSLVEGAGGLLVPYDEHHTIADLARLLRLPLLLVSPNRLGTLSHTLTAIESALKRSLSIAAIVLTELDPRREAAELSATPSQRPGDRHTFDLADISHASNAEVLRRVLQRKIPVLEFPHVADDNTKLAEAAIEAGIIEILPV